MAKRVLAFDFGASSGRAILGTFEGGKIAMKEIHRFPNDPVELNGTLHWDVLRLFHEIKQGINKAVLDGGFDAIGIDTWGVDFGLIDEKGRLVANPVHYRDERTEGMMEEVFKTVPREELYGATGTQLMRINTLFQLMALKTKEPELLERADTLLLMPDLFAYFLTGVKKAEYTEVSTTNMLNPNTGDWARDILEKLDLPTRLLPEIVDAGTVYGPLKKALCEELGCEQVPVIAVATHDTGSAVAAVPAAQKDFVYISNGTWSLFGTELEKPAINEKSAGLNFTNEGGFNRITRLLKNIMGMWLPQEARRQWIREGVERSFGQLAEEAAQAAPFAAFIDPDDPSFELPGNMPLRVQEYCRATGQTAPEGIGPIMRCIYESLVLKYRYTFLSLGKITGKDYRAIHMIGGGIQNTLVCQMTADACGVPVIAGPVEATAMGNIAVQLIALGEIGSLAEARQVVAASEAIKVYEPRNTADYAAVYEKYLKITNL